MRPVRSVVRKFILPVACFAAAAWAFGFSVMYATIPKRDMGISLLLALAGIVLLLPWLLMALSVFQRMREGPVKEPRENHPDENA
jgi:Zn-dependent protease with chaperone function